MQDLASEFSKISGGNTPGPLQRERGDSLPHPTPSPAFGRCAGHKRPGVGTQTLVPLNFSAVFAPLRNACVMWSSQQSRCTTLCFVINWTTDRLIEQYWLISESISLLGSEDEDGCGLVGGADATRWCVISPAAEPTPSTVSVVVVVDWPSLLLRRLLHSHSHLHSYTCDEYCT